MDVALCYPSVVPARGGCETYISDLARRLARDGHGVLLFASEWDAKALPASTHFYRIAKPRGPRFLRPWRFARACEAALRVVKPQVSIGFDKTWGQDVLYPQGGLHVAAQAQNVVKHGTAVARVVARMAKFLDPANRSFARLERKQYLGWRKPLVVVNSQMVRGHFEQFYGVPSDTVRVLHSAIDPMRFVAEDRPKRRAETRDGWGVSSQTSVGLFVATNYRLKGLGPLLRGLAKVPQNRDVKLIVAGHARFENYCREALSLGLADRVKFLGFVPDPKDLYFAADFLAHPTFYDPCSLVVLEALACGLPVLTTRFNGAAELMTPACGVVVQNPHDAEELGVGLGRMIDPTFRTTAPAAAREAAKNWTFEHHYRTLMTIFEEVQGVRRAA